MKLIFLLQKEAWFLEHELAWYRLSDMKEVELALAVLALKMINQQDLIEQPHQAGTAQVTQHDEQSISFSLVSPDSKLIDTLNVQLTQDILLNVDWNTKPFRDGWMSAETMVTLDNVGSMYLEAYLPANSDSEGKLLKVTNSTTGTLSETWIARDEKTRIALVENGCEGKVSLSLKCEPERIDQSTDPRQLGFVLVAEQVLPV